MLPTASLVRRYAPLNAGHGGMNRRYGIDRLTVDG